MKAISWNKKKNDYIVFNVSWIIDQVVLVKE